MDAPITSLPLSPPSHPTTLPHPHFSLDLCRYPLSAATLYTTAALQELNHLVQRGFPVRAVTQEELEALGLAVQMTERDGTRLANLLVVDAAGTIAWIQLSGGEEQGRPRHARMTVAGADGADARTLADALQRAFGTPEPEGDLVPMTFWSRSQHGPRPMPKLISAPEWSEIEGNYAPGARAELARLMATRSLDGGRLILWQGPPGTGKTYALRALARAWRSWCDLHVVVDPDVFFGEGSSYLMDILFLEPRRDAHGVPKARLLVLEDAGELVAAQARAETGQALSRLLNVTDGLLGQGLDLCTLITTNEPLDQLHPAVLRPGRCAAQVHIPPLDVATADTWLQSRGGGVGGSVSEPTSLAELFARPETAMAGWT